MDKILFKKVFLTLICFCLSCFSFLSSSQVFGDMEHDHHGAHGDSKSKGDSPDQKKTKKTKKNQKLPKISLSHEINQVSTESATLKFKVLENKKPLLDSDLNLVHERKIHMLIFDKSLTEFQHLHPLSENDLWQTTARFTHKGDYQIFVQGQTREGIDFNLPWNMKVTSGQEPHLIPKTMPVTWSGRDQESIVSLEEVKLLPKKMYMINMKFSRGDGKKSQITPYLGAIAHVVSIRLGGSELLHVHPMEGKTSDSALLHVEFPEKGYYRLWIQFNDHEVLRTVPLSVVVGSP